MALWRKIRSLSDDCQQKILSLYNEEHPEFKLPIELRNIFPEVIENAVCGGTLEGGLDPTNPRHRDLIINFLTSLITSLKKRLGSTEIVDEFYIRRKLFQSLTNFTEKRQTDPIRLFEYIRNRIKAEMMLVSEHEAVTNGIMTQEPDPMLESIRNVKILTTASANILKGIRSNEEQSTLILGEKQKYEPILNNPEQLRNYNQQVPDGEIRMKEYLAHLQASLRKNTQILHKAIQRFKEIMEKNLSTLAALQAQVVAKITIWKHEQQRMANETNKLTHSVNLDRLQIWCEELAVLIWNHYEQLNEAEMMFKNVVCQSESHASDLKTVQNCTEEVVKLLQDILNHSLIVEEQPPQVIQTGRRLSKPVVVSLLVGKILHIHMNRPMLESSIISEEQVRSLPVADKVETIGGITNGQLPMECKEGSKRLSVRFETMQLNPVRRMGNERVSEEKSCLYFICLATVGPLKFKVSTISLPVVVLSHWTQEPVAMATILWDNVLAEMGRIPFQVPDKALWSDIAEILNAKFVKLTGRGLTEENLAFLANKAFRNKQPQPEAISWTELCKDNLPELNFTFWTWFHAALKLMEKKEFKEIWKAGLVMGFIDRESAEKLVSGCKPGTILLRFPDSLTGAITIAVFVKPGITMSIDPKDLHEPLKVIKDIGRIRYLFQPQGCISKDEAFSQFYEKATPPPQSAAGLNKKPYSRIRSTILDDDTDILSGDSTPGSDENRRMSFPEMLLSPVSMLSHPWTPLPPLSLPIMQQIDSGAASMGAVSNILESSQTGALSTSPGNLLSDTLELGMSLESPTWQVPHLHHYQYDPEMFDDLLTLIENDIGGEAMDINNQ